jgi:hypothetical protein
MKKTLACITVLLLTGMSATAHRLDEYLQATLISVAKDRIQAQVRLAPGVMVLPVVLGSMDTNADGILSDAEQRSYAERVLRDFSLTLDGNRLLFRIVSLKFPTVEDMKQGTGELQLELSADVPAGGGRRRLLFENHHQSSIAAYLVNCLVPNDPDIRIVAQNRNYQQSSYELIYEQARGSVTSSLFPGAGGWLGAVALLLIARLAFVLRNRTVARDAFFAIASKSGADATARSSSLHRGS